MGVVLLHFFLRVNECEKHSVTSNLLTFKTIFFLIKHIELKRNNLLLPFNLKNLIPRHHIFTVLQMKLDFVRKVMRIF